MMSERMVAPCVFLLRRKPDSSIFNQVDTGLCRCDGLMFLLVIFHLVLIVRSLLAHGFNEIHVYVLWFYNRADSKLHTSPQ